MQTFLPCFFRSEIHAPEENDLKEMGPPKLPTWKLTTLIAPPYDARREKIVSPPRLFSLSSDGNESKEMQQAAANLTKIKHGKSTSSAVFCYQRNSWQRHGRGGGRGHPTGTADHSRATLICRPLVGQTLSLSRVRKYG